MTSINIQDIERDPLAFVRRVESGEAMLVVRGEEPLAEIRPVAAVTDGLRPFGLCAGEFQVPDDFDNPLPLMSSRTSSEHEGIARHARLPLVHQRRRSAICDLVGYGM